MQFGAFADASQCLSPGRRGTRRLNQQAVDAMRHQLRDSAEFRADDRGSGRKGLEYDERASLQTLRWNNQEVVVTQTRDDAVRGQRRHYAHAPVARDCDMELRRVALPGCSL